MTDSHLSVVDSRRDTSNRPKPKLYSSCMFSKIFYFIAITTRTILYLHETSKKVASLVPIFLSFYYRELRTGTEQPDSFPGLRWESSCIREDDTMERQFTITLTFFSFLHKNKIKQNWALEYWMIIKWDALPRQTTKRKPEKRLACSSRSDSGARAISLAIFFARAPLSERLE